MRKPKKTPFPKGGSKFAIRVACDKCGKGYVVEPSVKIPDPQAPSGYSCFYSSSIDFCRFCGNGSSLRRDSEAELR